jgi:hypothetical protein
MHSFVTSSEIVTIFAYSGSLSFDPVSNTLHTPSWGRFMFNMVVSDEIPTALVSGEDHYQTSNRQVLQLEPRSIQIAIASHS